LTAAAAAWLPLAVVMAQRQRALLEALAWLSLLVLAPPAEPLLALVTA